MSDGDVTRDRDDDNAWQRLLRAYLREHGIGVGTLAYRLGVPYDAAYRWLRWGSVPRDYGSLFAERTGVPWEHVKAAVRETLNARRYRRDWWASE
jgi:hypothetical protein